MLAQGMKTSRVRGGAYFSISKHFCRFAPAAIGLALVALVRPARANPIIAATFDGTFAGDPTPAATDTDITFAAASDDLLQSGTNIPGDSFSSYLFATEIEQTISPEADTEFLSLTAPDAIDGITTRLVHFNPNGIVDGSNFGNWADSQSNNLAQVQDANAIPSDQTSVVVSEMAALDGGGLSAISASTAFDSNVVPKAGSIGVLAVSGLGLLVLQRRAAGR
jgi:hypothetical protein